MMPTKKNAAKKAKTVVTPIDDLGARFEHLLDKLDCDFNCLLSSTEVLDSPEANFRARQLLNLLNPQLKSKKDNVIIDPYLNKPMRYPMPKMFVNTRAQAESHILTLTTYRWPVFGGLLCYD